MQKQLDYGIDAPLVIVVQLIVSATCFRVG
jgi:hypothetical protein